MAESIMDQIEDSHLVSGARILVVGVGGGGGNAVKNMIDLGLGGVEFICANTDLQALNSNPAPVHIQLGEKLTRGLGAGSNPDVGREAANESLQAIQQALANADMVFVTAGMGGGTGTGAAPIVAETAKKNGALTVAVVTRPFSYEGRKRAENAQAGIDELSKHVDCIITIPNDRIMTLAPKKTPMRELMSKANDVLYYGVKGISDVITCPGYINLDFADVRTCMTESGLALMGMGSGKGENRAEDAVRSAIASPLLEDVSLSTAKAILYNITAPEDITGEEMEQIGERLREAVPEEANIVFGVVFDDKLEDEIRVTVVATGIESEPVLEQKSAVSPYGIPAQKSQVPQPPRTAPAPHFPKPEPAAQRAYSQRTGMSNEPGPVTPMDPSSVTQPRPAQPAQQPAFNDIRSRRDLFRQKSRVRWEQEIGEIPHMEYDGSGIYNPKNLSEMGYDENLDIPSFLRRKD